MALGGPNIYPGTGGLILSPRLLVKCDTCGAEEYTYNGENPDAAVECGCCPEVHDHAGKGCRTVTITAFAHLVGTIGE